MKKETKIGIIVTVVLAFLFWGFNYLKGKDIFKLTDDYYIRYNDVRGLLESNSVFINGYKVGRVSGISLDEETPKQLVVQITINSGIKIPYTSKARIYSLDVMGSKAIELVLSDEKRLCHDGDTLQGDIEMSLAKQIDPIKIEIYSVLNRADSLLESMNKMFDKRTVYDLKKTLESLRITSETLAGSSEQISLALSNIESVSRNLKESNEYIKNVAANMSSFSDSLSQTQLKSTVNNLNKAIIQTNELLEKVSQGKGTLGKLMNNDSLYTSLAKATAQIDSLASDIERQPKKYVHFSVFGRKK